MSRAARPLPTCLEAVPFHVLTGIEEGMPRARLRGADLTMPSRGVRRVARALGVEPVPREHPFGA